VIITRGTYWQLLSSLLKEAFGGLLITLGGDQNIEDGAMLVHSAPQVTDFALDFKEDFVEVPFVFRLRPTSA
jgi:hypothetical protein